MPQTDRSEAYKKMLDEGTITAEEYERLMGSRLPEDMGKKYEDFIRTTVAYGFKVPSSVKAPPFEPDMVKMDTLKIRHGVKYVPTEVRFIDTWVDATNRMGVLFRVPIRLVMDENGTIVYALKTTNLGLTRLKDRWDRI